MSSIVEDKLGLELEEGLTEEQWAEEGQHLARAVRRNAWRIGDWVRHAEDNLDGGRLCPCGTDHRSGLRDASQLRVGRREVLRHVTSS